MKNRLWTLAGVLALLAVLGKFYAAPLVAQVRATLVQDRDSRARNLYQAVNNCFNVTSPCQITFAAVPAGKRLIIEQVSAIVTLPTVAGDALDAVELRGASVFQFLPLVPAPGNFGGQVQYVTNQTVLAAYDAGQVPEVDTFVASGSTFTTLASISGYMIDIP
jgi:hypothetical protein